VFPATRVSVLTGIAAASAAERQRALSRIVAAYWRAVYAYVRQRWRRAPADAEDLTQGFFAAAAEKEYLAAFDASKGRFRTFLRVCVDRFVGKAASADGAAKRGGAAVRLDLDFAGAEGELAGDGGIGDVERWFEREWARSVFAAAVEELRGRTSDLRFRLFARYDLVDAAERPTYGALADELGIAVTDVTNHLAAVRRELRTIVLETLRELTASDEEYRTEARALLGVREP
jgi:DNA-directed RNA polymerase specialized sigma24 family protein